MSEHECNTSIDNLSVLLREAADLDRKYPTLTSSLQSFHVVGVNHATAPIDVREKVAVSRSDLAESFEKLAQMGVNGAVLLSTCNRTELYCDDSDLDTMRSFFAWRSDGYNFSSQQMFYLSGLDAVRHLLSVSCGLDSQILGENEILGQVKRALLSARLFHRESSRLNALFERALKLGKTCRSETAINYGSISIASLAVQATQQGARSLKRVAVLGTGEMGTTVARELRKLQVQELFVASHTVRYAERLAAEVDATVCPIHELSERAPRLDAIFCATEAPHPVIDQSFFGSDRQAEIALIDLGMPRNVCPSVRELSSVRLFDLDDLSVSAERSLEVRRSAVPEVQSRIDSELERLERSERERKAVPLIKKIDSRKTDILEGEVEALLEKLELDEKGEQLVREFAHRIMSQAINPQIDFIKSLSIESKQPVDALERLIDGALSRHLRRRTTSH